MGALFGIGIDNALIDIDSDRSHPTKCKRPIAAGKIKPNIAFSLSLFLRIVLNNGLLDNTNNFSNEGG